MAKQFLKLPGNYTDEDAIISGFIQAAREYGEIYTWRALAQRPFVQVLDSFPYFTDTIQSQLAYPPSYYSLPRYSTTLWNYSQMIKLGYSPVISVESMTYVDANGLLQTLLQDVDFTLDNTSEPSRIFPPIGTYWPPSLYVANSLQINFTAGYDPDPAAIATHVLQPAGVSPPNQQGSTVIVSGVPQMIILGILNLVAYWFQNRGEMGKIPPGIEQIFYNNAVMDFAPTRG